MIRTFILLFFVIPHCIFAVSKVCWTQEQDAQLLDSIQRHATNNWLSIAGGVSGKNSKQCRERYKNHLDPLIDRSSLSNEEIDVLNNAVKELGTSWITIANNYFTLQNGKRRTDLHIKNVWNSHHGKELGEKKRKNTYSHESHLKEEPTTSANKKMKVAQLTVTDSVFIAQLPYSSAPSGGPYLLSNSQLLLNGQPLILPSLLMLSSNVTHSGLVAPYNAPLQLPSNSISNQQSLFSTDIVVDEILSGPELAKILEGGGFW